MARSSRLGAGMTQAEQICGWCYLPFYVVLLGLILSYLVRLLDLSVSTLTLNFAYTLINFSLTDLIGVGSSVNISIFLGKKENDEANNYFTCSCLMIIITGVISGAIFFFAAPWLMQFMGAEEELADLAIQYIRVYAIASPFTTMVFAVDNFLRICGKIKSSMALNIVMSILNIRSGISFFCSKNVRHKQELLFCRKHKMIQNLIIRQRRKYDAKRY